MRHVAVPRHLRLPAFLEGVLAVVQLHDPDLRVRRSAEKHELFVIERRCRKAPAVNTSMANLSDMHVQARDGYIHVATTNLAWMLRPWNIMRALTQEGVDLWAAGGAQRVADEEEYEEQWAKETRRRRRLGLYRDIATDGWNTLSRMNIAGERSRINNPGLPTSRAEATA